MRWIIIILSTLILGYSTAGLAAPLGSMGIQKLLDATDQRIAEAKRTLSRLTAADFYPWVKVGDIYDRMILTERYRVDVPCRHEGKYLRVRLEDKILQCIIWDDGSFDIHATKPEQEPTEVGEIFTDAEAAINMNLVLPDKTRVKEKIIFKKDAAKGLLMVIRKRLSAEVPAPERPGAGPREDP